MIPQLCRKRRIASAHVRNHRKPVRGLGKSGRSSLEGGRLGLDAYELWEGSRTTLGLLAFSLL
jgi:hypothetical protein